MNTFSLKPGSLRFISPRRIIAVLISYPLFALLFISNHFFLLLDEIFFFPYRKLQVKKAVFIIGVPRSATTFLFKVLLEDRINFHGFKMWELVFAPSIIQKYFFLGLIWLDRKCGCFLLRLSRFLDKIIFGDFRNIHEMGLSKPEEDEVLFLYNFSSLYLYYFFPGLKILDKFLYHDTQVPEKVKKRNINFYFRCIQRHNYVFDRKEKAFFLSKNPTFIPRFDSIVKKFPGAYIIYPLRSPYETIPSTISLNSNIFSNFCRLPEKNPLKEDTTEFMVNWYIHASSILSGPASGKSIIVRFEKIREEPAEVFLNIYEFLGMSIRKDRYEKIVKEYGKGKYRSKHRYEAIQVNRDYIRDRLKGIVPDELL
ncbi:MAG: sulfotransferase [Marinilabiliaceae bacterium]|nr:sulfotransferase [Marinilabiliaceae bacterium]